eukprot:4675476-Pyramimonas_sp.AAC.1
MFLMMLLLLLLVMVTNMRVMMIWVTRSSMMKWRVRGRMGMGMRQAMGTTIARACVCSVPW